MNHWLAHRSSRQPRWIEGFLTRCARSVAAEFATADFVDSPRVDARHLRLSVRTMRSRSRASDVIVASATAKATHQRLRVEGMRRISLSAMAFDCMSPHAGVAQRLTQSFRRRQSTKGLRATVSLRDRHDQRLAMSVDVRVVSPMSL